MAKKSYKVRKIHHGRENIWEGTVEELSTSVFGYTLKCGHSYNARIPLMPKTAKGLVSALNNSVRATQGGCYDPDYYELVTGEAA